MSVHPSICLSTGGVPISHNALQHFPECHEAVGGYPDTPPWGGTRVRYPPGGYLDPPGGVPGSGTPPGGYPGQVPPGGVPGSGTPPGGYLDPPGGYPGQVPPGGVPGPPTGVPGSGGVPRPPPGGGTRVGQQKEYSLHGGRYASCVHAGGLSCLIPFDSTTQFYTSKMKKISSRVAC